MDGFTLKGVPVPVVVQIDEASLKSTSSTLDSFIKELQQKCKLTLAIDTSATQAQIKSIAEQITKSATTASGKGSSGKSKTSSEKEFDTRKLNAFNNAMLRMQLRLGDLGVGKTTKEFEEFKTALADVAANGGKGFDTLAQKSILAQHSIQSLSKELTSAKQINDNFTDSWFTKQGSRIDNLAVGGNASLIADARAKLNDLNDLKSKFTGTAAEIEEFNTKMREYEQLMSRIGTERTMTRSLEDQSTTIANLQKQYESYMAKYGQNLQRNLPLLEKFRKFGADLSSGALNDERATRVWSEITEEAKKSGVEIETVRQRMTNLFGQHFNTALIMLAIRGLRQALQQLWQDIKEVNEALVQTQIVTGLSGAALEAYTDKAYAAADKSKDKVTNILSEATAFGRLGYDSELSMQLAQLTSMYSKLGDVDTSDATDAITALMKAFNLENADEIELALDKMIYVGNNFPISAAGLGEGLNNAASALSSAGNSLEQTLALLMAANATVQNPSKSSTAMRTITARIRNTKAELDELGEELDEKYDTVAKYQKELLGLTGVDILDATGKNFRATYDILKDLADVWGTLTSAQQAAVTTMLAGTRNQDIFASLMKNFPDAEKAMGGMGDAAGLMDEKFKAVEDSISGSLSELSNAWSKFSNTLLNSGDVTAFIKMITGIVKALTSLTKVFGGGTLITGVLSLTMLINKFKQFGQIYPQMQATLNSLGANSPFKGVQYASLTEGEIKDVASALSGYTNAQQRYLMTQAGMSVAAQKQVLEFQGMSTAALAAGGAMSTLGASIDGLKAKITAFVLSGNAWITIIMLLIQGFMILRNTQEEARRSREEAAEASRRELEEETQKIRSDIQTTHSAMSSFESEEKSVDSYIDKLRELQNKLSDCADGSNEYKSAMRELYDVNTDIVNQFGNEANAIRAVSGELDAYAKQIGKTQVKQQFDKLTSDENFAGLHSALKLFGYDESGSKNNDTNTISINGVHVSGAADSWLEWDITRPFSYQVYYDDNEMDQSALASVAGIIGNDLANSMNPTFFVDPANTIWNNTETPFAEWREILDPDNSLKRTFASNDNIEITSLSFSGSIKDIIDNLNSRMEDSLKNGDAEGAAWISTLIGAIKHATNYDESLAIIQEYFRLGALSGQFGDDIADVLWDTDDAYEEYQEHLKNGDYEKAREALQKYYQYVNSLHEIANDRNNPFLSDYIENNYKKNEFLEKLVSGGILTSDDIERLRQLSVSDLDTVKDYNDEQARKTGLLDAYYLYQRLLEIAGANKIDVGEVISALVTNGYINSEGYFSGSYFSATGTPKNFNDYAVTGKDSAEDAAKSAAKLGSAVESYIKAKSAFDQTFQMDGDQIVVDPNREKETIDVICEYLGISIDKVTEKEYDAIKQMFTLREKDIYGVVQQSIAVMFNAIEKADPKFDWTTIIDADTGVIEIEKIRAAIESLPDSADKAGYLANVWWLSWLQEMFGVRFTSSNGAITATGGEDSNGYIPNHGKPSIYSKQYSVVGKDSTSEAQSAANALGEAVVQYQNVRSALFDVFNATLEGDGEFSIVDPSKVEEATKLLADYLGISEDNMEKLTEDNIGYYLELLELRASELEGAIESSVIDTLVTLEKNGVYTSDIIRDGIVDFDLLESAINQLPDTVDKAGLFANAKWLSWLSKNKALTINALEDIDDIIEARLGLSGNNQYATSLIAAPSNYKDQYSFRDQNTVTEATGRIGSLDQTVTEYLSAKNAFDEAAQTDTEGNLFIDPEASEDAIDLVNDYFGTSFEDITEQNYALLQGMFESAGNDIYGYIGTAVSEALNYLNENADKYSIDMDAIVDPETGLLNIAALTDALSGIPESADQAGALAVAALIDKLSRIAGMTFALKADGYGEDLLRVDVSGGSASPSSVKKSGGGGGHHSQISDDIENLERMIKLFRTLLNYYDEGSNQWIARQQQIIDKYKAGVEIAMAEYDRLIKKGLKQTDDDVKKIVDTILEYQDDIYNESKNLWEAVRQNQIDSLKHLKDQNDATIELEKTHHDLLNSIRDERRELEDELKAARDAYSEVMTPEELDAMFSIEDYAELMDKLAGIEGDAMSLYRDYKEQIAAVSEDETYMIEHITDEFKRQYDLKMKEYEVAKAELAVARAQQNLENIRNEQNVAMLIGGRWQWVADPEKVLEAEQQLADAEQELADAQDEYDFQSVVHAMEAQSSEIQRQIDALEALTFSMDDLAEQIHLFSDSVYKELLTYLSRIAQETLQRYEGDTAVPAFAEGGVIKRSGLAMVHSGEPIFSTADAERLWRFVHDLGDTPVDTSGVYSGIASKLITANPGAFGGASSMTIDNSINIPGGIHVHGEIAQQLITLLKEVVAPYQPNI